MRVVRGNLGRADLGEHRRACDAHQAFLAVEGQDFAADVLDARVDHVQSVLTRVDIGDDPVVKIK